MNIKGTVDGGPGLPRRSKGQASGAGWLMPMLLVALLSMFGCATRHSTMDLGTGVTIHTFRRDYANAHVVVRGADAFMFDSGLETNASALVADLRSAGIEPSSLRAIVLSHGHADHAGGAAYFRREFGTPIVAGAADRELLATGRNDRLCPTNDDARSRLASDQAATYTPYVANVLVESELDLGALTGIPGRIVAMPGHTAGSLVVVLPDARAALVGDLFRGAIFGSSAEVHFYMCDLDDNRRDVRALLETLAPTADSFFTGHFGSVSRASVQKRFLGDP